MSGGHYERLRYDTEDGLLDAFRRDGKALLEQLSRAREGLSGPLDSYDEQRRSALDLHEASYALNVVIAKMQRTLAVLDEASMTVRELADVCDTLDRWVCGDDGMPHAWEACVRVLRKAVAP